MNKYLKKLRNIVGTARAEAHSLQKSLYTAIKIKLGDKLYNGAKLEIGSGPKRREDFITLDLSRETDYPYDLALGLPFPDNSIALIYAEHVIEHFYRGELKYILRECHRVLLPGSKLSVAVPNIHMMLRAYASSVKEFEEGVYFEYPKELSSRLDIINYMFFLEGHHKNAFDQENLTMALQEAGFRDVRVRDFDTLLDSEIRRKESLYCEARK